MLTNEEKQAVDRLTNEVNARTGKPDGIWIDTPTINLALQALEAATARAEAAEASLREKELADLRWNTCENCGCSV